MMVMAIRNAVYVIGIASLLVAYTSAHDMIKFGYTGLIGPDKWGSLSPEFATCSKGIRQSPINIIKQDAICNSKLEVLEREYTPTNATLVNNGFNIALRFQEAIGAVMVEGKSYTLQQLHYHSPSEHTIDGVRYPMELHLVHMSDDGNVTVVAILYQFGQPDPFLLQIKDGLDELAKVVCRADEEGHIPVGVVQTKAIECHDARKYYRYYGSLTIPPCTENVIWNVLGNVREMSVEQAAALKAPLELEFKNNSRPTQALNRRSVQLYDVEQSLLPV